MKLLLSALLLCLLCACQTQPSASPELLPTECPPASRWNGKACIWQSVVTEVKCPQGARWNGTECVANGVRCPVGMLFNGAVCVVHPGSPPPSPAPGTSSSGTIESIATGGRCLFAIDGANLNPRQPRARIVRVVDVGKHQVSCRADGVLQTKTVAVTAGATVVVLFGLEPKPGVPEGLPPHQGAAGGTLIGIAVGGACLWSVDGKAHGVSASVRLRTTAGAHSVACTSGGTTRTQRVTVSASKPGVATFRVGTTVSSGGGGASGATGPSTRPPALEDGSLVAIAIGGSCAFAVDGTPRGVSSSLRIRVPSGAHRVDCLAGGVAHSQTVVVTPAKPGVATFRLPAARPDGNSR